MKFMKIIFLKSNLFIILPVFCLSFVLRSESETAVGISEATNNSNPLFYYIEDSTKAAEELLKAADVIAGGNVPLTVQVRKPEEFPRQLFAGQRVAVFLPEIEPANLFIVLEIEAEKLAAGEKGQDESPALSVIFNKHLLFRSTLSFSGKCVNAIIPYSYLEKGENVLEIINLSRRAFRFKGVKIDHYDSSEGLETKKIGKENGDNFAKPLGRQAQKQTFEGGALAKKAPTSIANRIVEHIRKKRELFSFGELAREPSFLDPVSGKAIEGYDMVKRIAPFFEGNPRLVGSNLIPVADNDTICRSQWVAVRNADGLYTVLIAGWYESGKSVRLSLPLEPEQNNQKFRYYTASGTAVPNEKFELKELDVRDGIIQCEIQLADCVLIRFVRDGVKEPEKFKFTEKNATGTPLFQKGILKVTNRRIKADLIRTTVHGPNGYLGISGKAYSGKGIDATSATIDGVKNVIPWDKKSDLVEISFQRDKKDNSGGATLHFGSGPDNAEEFTFWVYPRAEKNIKRTTLQFYLRSDGKTHYLAADLVPEKWQRVIMPSEKIKPPYWGEITIVGDPRLPEYKDGAKVSFEFNGFCVTGDRHPKFGISGLKSARIAGTEKEKIFVFCGEPGEYFGYRHHFTGPIEIESIAELSGGKTLKYVYKKEAQLLEISGFFPLLKPSEVIDDYTPEEKMGFTPDPENPYSLSAEARKVLIPGELKEFEDGKSAIIVVRSKIK